MNDNWDEDAVRRRFIAETKSDPLLPGEKVCLILAGIGAPIAIIILIILVVAS